MLIQYEQCAARATHSTSSTEWDTIYQTKRSIKKETLVASEQKIEAIPKLCASSDLTSLDLIYRVVNRLN